MKLNLEETTEKIKVGSLLHFVHFGESRAHIVFKDNSVPEKYGILNLTTGITHSSKFSSLDEIDGYLSENKDFIKHLTENEYNISLDISKK